MATAPAFVGRAASLDGLRGIAAVVVLVHHVLVLVPALAQPYFTGTGGDAGAWSWLLYSPAHLLWAGTEAVYLFFVLSGVVLALGVRSVSTYRWGSYYPSRLVRLYGPVIAAVMFAAITIVLVPRVGLDGHPWLEAHPASYTPATFLQDIVLLDGTSGVVTPLWSLKWEVLFSLLLPVYVLLSRLRFPVLTVAVALAVCSVGFATGSQLLSYLPMFLVGTVIGANLDRLSEFAGRMPGAAQWGWAATVVLGLALVVVYWCFANTWPQDWWRGITRPLAVLGCGLLVIGTLYWRPLRNLLSRRPFRLLGLISFSLYLVHEPIVVAMGYLFAGSSWALPVAFIASVLASIAFYLLVENPLHRLARRIRQGRPASEPESVESN